MFKRFLTIACLFSLLVGAWNVPARSSDKNELPFTDIYFFGDSLSDSGNLFCISGDKEPPNPLYFDGRYSDGPVWVESLSLLLDLDVNFETDVCTDYLANNQAIGGKRFLIANLPNLGDTPGGSMISERLNFLTAAHNALLAHAISKLRARHQFDIVLLDVNATFAQMLDDPEVFGFDKEKVEFFCLIQQPDGTREPSNLCPETDDGETYDATGVLFWDLIHPTAAVHRQIAIVAHTTLVAARNERLLAKDRDDDGHDDDDDDD